MFEPTLAKETREKIEAVLYDGRVVPRHTANQHFYEDVTDKELYASVTTKTSLLSREYYKQLAADKAVDYIQEHAYKFQSMTPEEISGVFSYAREAHVHDLNKAGMWGTHGHDMVDRYVRTWIEDKKRPLEIRGFATAETSNEGICAALSAMKFFDDYTLFPIVSEKKLISKKYKYAGTLDSLWVVGEVYKNREGDRTCEHIWFEKGKRKITCVHCGRTEELSIMLGDWKTSNQIFGMGTKGKFDYAMQVSAYAQALKELAKVHVQEHWIVRLDKQRPHYEVGFITDVKEATKAFVAINTVSDFARSPVMPITPLVQKRIITL